MPIIFPRLFVLFVFFVVNTLYFFLYYLWLIIFLYFFLYYPPQASSLKPFFISV